MYFVYILSNWNDSVLYIGVTSNLPRRLYEHRNNLVDGFTKQYNVHKLVYYEHTNDVYSAISREKQLKGWRRSKKDALITKMNPDWHDLSAVWDRPTM
ncbi:MAG: GIY-YIG nuclease family protein [Oscillospiraceae bacterium]|nr:GIY-YIG nuclease family protein [Oscillospiraceae bacterium]